MAQAKTTAPLYQPRVGPVVTLFLLLLPVLSQLDFLLLNLSFYMKEGSLIRVESIVNSIFLLPTLLWISLTLNYQL